jgi:4-hydroxybenzoate polyprenyltransferase
MIINSREFVALCVLGALSVKGRDLTVADGALLFLFAFLCSTWGCTHNDYCNVWCDSISGDKANRPLLKGTISKQSALIFAAICMLSTFMFPFFFPHRVPLLLIVASVTVCGLTYNIMTKRYISADIFFALASTSIFLFGVVAVSNTNNGFPKLGMFTWVLLGITVIHVFFFNSIISGFKDIEADRKSGGRTIACILVVNGGNHLRFRQSGIFFFLTLKALQAALAFTPFLIFGYSFLKWQIYLLVLYTVLGMVLTFLLFKINPLNRRRIGYHTMIHEIVWCAIAPIMLVEFAGLPWILFLILAPGLFYFFFSYLIHREEFPLPFG